MGCELCDGHFDELKLTEYNFWTLYLHDNQFYLGRAIAALRNHREDPAELSENETNELFAVLREYQDALRKVTSPDLINYSFLGNRLRHVHMHIIPRYASYRELGGIKFIDPDWGNPYDMKKKLEISKEDIHFIKQKIQTCIAKTASNASK